MLRPILQIRWPFLLLHLFVEKLWINSRLERVQLTLPSIRDNRPTWFQDSFRHWRLFGLNPCHVGVDSWILFHLKSFSGGQRNKWFHFGRNIGYPVFDEGIFWFNRACWQKPWIGMQRGRHWWPVSVFGVISFAAQNSTNGLKTLLISIESTLKSQVLGSGTYRNRLQACLRKANFIVPVLLAPTLKLEFEVFLPGLSTLFWHNDFMQASISASIELSENPPQFVRFRESQHILRAGLPNAEVPSESRWEFQPISK